MCIRDRLIRGGEVLFTNTFVADGEEIQLNDKRYGIKVNYNSDSYNNLGGSAPPTGHGGMSSAHCSSSSSVSGQGNYDYGTNIPNY